MRVLSGIQPSGKIHLGNYFGAIRQHIALQDDAASPAARGQVLPLVLARLRNEAEQLAETPRKLRLREAAAAGVAAGTQEVEACLSAMRAEGDAKERALAERWDRELVRFRIDEVERYYFIANYHALTTIRDARTLRGQTLDVALDYLSLGLDPERSCIYRQSDVPEVTELSWMLSSVTPMGLLERCHAYKDKVARGIAAEHGLFAYPVLMAADILIVDAAIVPVGQDQKQHVEVTRDLAQAFNNAYGEVLVLPEPYIEPSTSIVPGTDGQKMSKSYGNTIDVFASGKELKRQVMGIVTDSTPLEAPKDPEKDNVLALLRLFASPEEAEDWARRYRAGGTGYGHAKLRLIELIDERFGPARQLRAELAAHPDQVDEILQVGAARARQAARRTIDRARAACGLH
jgi:tryptophanyl-tRNA synthetase